MSYTWTQDVTPGAKERIEAKLKRLPEIEKERPCSGCANNNRRSGFLPVFTGEKGCRGCNFNHDNYIPLNYTESTPKL